MDCDVVALLAMTGVGSNFTLAVIGMHLIGSNKPTWQQLEL